MKTVHVNTSDIKAGAGRAAYRLHKGLQAIGEDSTMLVQYKETNDNESVIGHKNKHIQNILKVYSLIDKIPLLSYKNYQNTPWSPQWLPNNTHKRINKLESDIVHLHWVCGGFLSVKDLSKIKQTIVWTLHDMWPFTGGCHYNDTCNKYEKMCTACPQLGTSRQSDLSNWVWKNKKKYWEEIDMTIVTPSTWLAKCAHESSLFQNKEINVIPNGIDTEQYKPVEKENARKQMDLELNKKYLLFGAMDSTTDKRKGFQYLKPALENLKGNTDIELVVFGNSKTDTEIKFELPVHYTGHIPEEKLTTLYSAVDAFVAPSLQDNLPNTIMESLACGLPVIAFNVGGIPDMVKHQKNGYLAKPYEPQDITKGIEWVLKDDKRINSLSAHARNLTIQNYEYRKIASLYKELYINKIK